MLDVRKTLVVGAGVFSLGIVSMGAQAALIANGMTFSVASGDPGPLDQGTHYHSNAAGMDGPREIPRNKAEVGGFERREEVRGLSEFDITGISGGGPAYVSFNVYDTYGLQEQLVDDDFNPFDPDIEWDPAIFDIDVVSYAANNQEDLSDWGAVWLDPDPDPVPVTTFSTEDLNTGDILSFDVSDLLDSTILAGRDSFGIRLQPVLSTFRPDGPSPAFTFDNFRLTSTNESTVTGGNAVPEPGTLGLLMLGLAGVIGFTRNQRTSR